ncbi:peptidase inhibitor family I36 protein [Streptomyces boninensis]|uniref:peptidase inhibitor family I36 protein n=1 Tax=Streptomyces boninensis TaxID=2039455 RepID=UPI003B226FCA
MKRTIAKAAIALSGAALAAAATLATAGPANAAWSDCPDGGLCAYLGDDGAGTPGVVYGDNKDLLQYYKFDNADSIYNNGNSCNVRIYNGRNYTGSSFVLDNGWMAPNLSSTYKDDVSSNNWCV